MSADDSAPNVSEKTGNGSLPDYLPDDLKKDILEKRRQDEIKAQEYEAAVKVVNAKVTLTGGFIAAAISIPIAGNPVIVLLQGAWGGFSSYYIADKQLDHIKGILFYGGCSCALSLGASLLGYAAWGPMSCFVWLIYLSMGALIAIFANDARSKLDGF